MKDHLVYSLGRRGFFSEINNLVLAKIYAEDNRLAFTANSYYWNCRKKLGMRDYFSNDIEEVSCLLSAQIPRTEPRLNLLSMNPHIWFGNLVYLNNMYFKFKHKNVILGSEIYGIIRSDEFMQNIPAERFRAEIRDLMQFNQGIKKQFGYEFARLGLPDCFLGVHIRRGDKITTGEMKAIDLEVYADAIEKSGYKSIYVATDDIESVLYLRDKLKKNGLSIYYNSTLDQVGFSEGSFNHKSRTNRFTDTITLLFDVYCLSKSNHFIGTYSSNLSRVIPSLIGFDKCVSLDEQWRIG